MDINKALSDELARIEESSSFSAKGHFNAASSWRRYHFWMGGPSSVCAAVAGVTALNGYPIVGGVLAIIVSVATGLMTFLNPDDRATAHDTSGRGYLSLAEDARRCRNIEVPTGAATAQASVETIAQRNQKLRESSPQIPEWAYRKAKIGIEVGEAAHAVDAKQKKPR